MVFVCLLMLNELHYLLSVKSLEGKYVVYFQMSGFNALWFKISFSTLAMTIGKGDCYFCTHGPTMGL